MKHEHWIFVHICFQQSLIPIVQIHKHIIVITRSLKCTDVQGNKGTDIQIVFSHPAVVDWTHEHNMGQTIDTSSTSSHWSSAEMAMLVVTEALDKARENSGSSSSWPVCCIWHQSFTRSSFINIYALSEMILIILTGSSQHKVQLHHRTMLLLDSLRGQYMMQSSPLNILNH